MPTNSAPKVGGLYGLDALLASQPRDPAVRGGIQTGFDGTDPKIPAQQEGRAAVPAGLEGLFEDQAAPDTPYAGLGPLLEADDAEAFKVAQDLVMRQERLAQSRLAQDVHWTAIKSGYAFSSLVKVADRDTYQQAFPPGRMARSAVPNKAADLCRKVTASLTVDPAKPDPQPEDDSETAQAGADLAKEFLRQDGNEQGTDDEALFSALIEGATSKSSTYAHVWVDPYAGGSVPKQIKAHPEALSPEQPLVGPDGMPTTAPVLRYVTPANQFTVNPSEAERTWLPKICVDRMDRRHVRCYPEYASVRDAERLVLLWYCTIAQARTRWPETVGQMDDAELAGLCDWKPPRFMDLLPPVLRARWRDSHTSGGDAKGSSGDERVLFYYLVYQRACPETPQGAYRLLNGAQSGTTLAMGTLSAEVQMPAGNAQDAEVTDLKIGDIPVVELTLVPDEEEGDPTGKALMSFIGGANESSATLMTSLLQQLDLALHPARFATATSPLNSEDVEESRATGKLATVMSKDDFPHYEETPTLPASTLPTVQWVHEQMDSSVGLSQAAQGADDSPEVSGVARRIAVNQSLVAVSPMQQAYHRARARYWRIKLQLAMQHFGVPQLLRYTGTDGAAKQEWFTGNNFAVVGGVNVAPGTGTLLPPTERVNFALQLRDAMVVDEDEASDIARPALTSALGIRENPHVQRIERQVSAFLEGPPPDYAQQVAMYEQAVIQHAQVAQQEVVATGQVTTPPPQAPWTPFATLPMDAELPIATIRKRRLARLMATTGFEGQPLAWQEVAKQAYGVAVEAIRATQMAAQAPAPGAQVSETEPEAAVAG